jgi:hypothetical protein
VIERPSDLQRLDMANQAREISNKFASMTKELKGEEEKPNIYTEKVKRYKQYVVDKIVRVDDDSHPMYNEWILREQAESQGVKFHCPVMWLQERGVNV